jgi:hypothetical protein
MYEYFFIIIINNILDIYIIFDLMNILFSSIK